MRCPHLMLPWCAAACAVVLSVSSALQEPARQGGPVGLEQALEQAEGLLKEAREAGKLDDLDGVHAAVHSACEVLDAVPAAGESEQAAKLLIRLGVVAAKARDYSGARQAWEHAATYLERKGDAEDEDLLDVQNNLAGIGYLEGDLVAARALMEQVVAIRERTRPPSDKQLLETRENLAVVKNVLGDVPGSLAILEEVLAIREQELPRDNKDLLETRRNRAIVLRQMGEHERALAEFERVRDIHRAAVQAEKLRATSRPMLDAEIAVAHTLASMGRGAEAQEVLERVHEELADLPREHLDVVHIDVLRARIRFELGDIEGARALNSECVAIYERTLPPDHWDRLRTRTELATNLAALGDWAALATQLDVLTGELSSWVQNCLIVSPREARERAARLAGQLSPLISYTDLVRCEAGDDRALRGSAAQLERKVFELLETLRSVAVGAVSLAAVTTIDPALKELRQRSAELRETIGVLVAQGREKGELARAIEERDRIEDRLRTRLKAAGLVTPKLELDALAAALPPNGAAVGFRRYAHTTFDKTVRNRIQRQDRLLAYVVRPGGKLVRVDLGPCDEIEAKVRRWRTAVGKSLQRGVTLTPEAEAIQLETGLALRKLVLDPVFEAAGDVATFHVCLDDVLHLVPLNALPLGPNGKVVGDRYEMLYETSFARLVQARPPRRGDDGVLRMVAVGGVNFNASTAQAASVSAEPVVAAEEAGYRGGASDTLRSATWAPLPQTKHEAESIVALFEEIFDGQREIEPVLLTRKAATKQALRQNAQGAQYLHLATHGYFAGEGTVGTGDRGDADLWRVCVGRADLGLAPMALCGLALSGANLGVNAAGQEPGILTAEELAGFDLSSCELAVLSACETNVGIRRAGLGIQSLQAALHAAGAQTGITTLWKVDDDAARELMTTFYTLYWGERGLSKARALWEAQAQMRTRWPLREWSGWVLTGDPR